MGSTKPLGRRYLFTKLLGAAEEFTYQLLAARQQQAAKQQGLNISEALTAAVAKFKATYSQQMTTTMYLAGAAMAPCLNKKAVSEDKLAVERLVIRTLPRPSPRNVSVGDVVAFHSPLAQLNDEQHVMVRRVAALEGTEMVSDSADDESFDIPKDHCWVLADNEDIKPPEVIDSRSFGFIPLSNIIGRVIYSAASVTEHGPVLNNALSVATDQPVVEQEVDVEKLFAGSNGSSSSSSTGGGDSGADK